MNGNLQVISGILELETGSAGVQKLCIFDFSSRRVDGAGRLLEANGPRNNFRGAPHVIISATDLTLSTESNTFFKISRTARADSLQIEYRIDSAGRGLQVDFLVIGEPA